MYAQMQDIFCLSVGIYVNHVSCVFIMSFVNSIILDNICILMNLAYKTVVVQGYTWCDNNLDPGSVCIPDSGMLKITDCKNTRSFS